ncbi:relaxase MobL, partial [Staphylococcus haemolyticus]
TQKIHNKLKDIPLNQWNYNNNNLKHIRPDIDKLSEMYIQKYHSKEYEDFKDKLVQQSDIYKSTYGEKSNYKNYINTKIEDLYSRSGNTILKNIKQIHQNPNILNGNYSNKQTNKTNNFKQNIKSRLAFNSSLNNIKQGLKKDFETERNIREYDYEFGIEKEQQRE